MSQVGELHSFSSIRYFSELGK